MTDPTETVRKQLHRVLLEGPATARDLSQRLGISERDVPDHLRHLARSLRHTGERLVVQAATCLQCDFAFTRRDRYTRPGRCPICRSTRTSLPAFHVEARKPLQLERGS